MSHKRAALVLLFFLLFAMQPVAAYAYLPVVIGLVGLVGGVGAALITAALIGAYLLYRLLRKKDDEEEEEDEEQTVSDKDNPPSH